MKPGLSKYFGYFAVLLSFISPLVLTACGDAIPTSPANSTTSSVPASVNSASNPTVAATKATTVITGGIATTVAPLASGDKTGLTDSEILLGSWGAQSGSAASLGLLDRTIDAYFKKVNEEGGVGGRKIKFIYEDDGYQAARTQTVVKKLVEQDKVFAFVGGLGTANNLAVQEYLSEKNIPNVAFVSGSGALVNPMRKTAFSLLTSYTFEGTLLAQYAADQLGTKKAAIFYQNDGLGKEGQQAFTKAARAKSLEIVAEVPYETGAADLATQAIRLQQSGADTVYLMGVAAPVSAVVKEMDKLGYKPKLLLSYVSNDPSFFNAAGKAADGVYTTNFTPLTDSDDPKIVRYRDFMKKYLPTETLGSYSLWGYLAAEIMVEGLKRAGRDLSRETLVAGLETLVDWKDSVAVNINYGKDNRAPHTSLYIIQFKDGKLSRLTDGLTAKP